MRFSRDSTAATKGDYLLQRNSRCICPHAHALRLGIVMIHQELSVMSAALRRRDFFSVRQWKEQARPDRLRKLEAISHEERTTSARLH